jgi:hypothetical protein
MQRRQRFGRSRERSEPSDVEQYDVPAARGALGIRGNPLPKQFLEAPGDRLTLGCGGLQRRNQPARL